MSHSFSDRKIIISLKMIIGFLKSHYPRQPQHKAAFLWLYFFVLALVFLTLASMQDEVSFLFSEQPIRQNAFIFYLWASLILKVAICVLAYISIKREFMVALLCVFNIKIAFNYVMSGHSLVTAWHYNAVGFLLLVCMALFWFKACKVNWPLWHRIKLAFDPVTRPMRFVVIFGLGLGSTILSGYQIFAALFYQKPFYTNTGSYTYAEEPISFTFYLIYELIHFVPLLFILLFWIAFRIWEFFSSKKTSAKY